MKTLYRYRCTCGHKGRGFQDGNLATMYGEQHVTDPKARKYVAHHWSIEERQPNGTWKG